MQREQYIWPTLILFLDVTHDLTAIWPDKSNKKAIDSYKVLPGVYVCKILKKSTN